MAKPRGGEPSWFRRGPPRRTPTKKRRRRTASGIAATRIVAGHGMPCPTKTKPRESAGDLRAHGAGYAVHQLHDHGRVGVGRARRLGRLDLARQLLQHIHEKLLDAARVSFRRFQFLQHVHVISGDGAFVNAELAERFADRDARASRALAEQLKIGRNRRGLLRGRGAFGRTCAVLALARAAGRFSVFCRLGRFFPWAWRYSFVSRNPIIAPSSALR